MRTAGKEKSGLRIGIIGFQLLEIIAGANDLMRNLIRALAVRSDTQIYFICPSQPDERLYAYYLQASPTMKRLLFDCEANTLARLRSDYEIDIFMMSIFDCGKSLPYLTYWPDCQHRRLPQFFNEESIHVRDERIKALLATGKPMIINSVDAKNDMIKFFGANPDLIFNLPIAPIVEFEHLIPRPELAAPFGLVRPYFICCNQFWIHKSLETVVQAAALAKQKGLDVDFVFTGMMSEPRFPDYPDGIRRMAGELGVDHSVKFLGYVDKAVQLELMKHSIAVVQPTLFEGGPGGGAVYDAIGIGVRAIVSGIDCNREHAEVPNKLVFFEPKNAADLFGKMVQMMRTPYVQPSIEDCYRITRRSLEGTSIRLYQAIDSELAKNRIPA